MFEEMIIDDSVRTTPENIGLDKKESVRKSLAAKYENKIIAEHGVVLAITDAMDIKGGLIEIEDAGIHYEARFKAIVFVPKLHEVIEGVVVDITEFGVFVRFGPIDGMCHISQIVNDFISYDRKTGILSGKDSSKNLKVGDKVRARLIGVSLDKKEVNKINLTMRQPGLGAIEWLEAEKKAKLKAKNKADTESPKKEASKKEAPKKEKAKNKK
ncbi:MAG: DNA-directed RNA polymerase [archaeon]